jgi:hypothetical protein
MAISRRSSDIDVKYLSVGDARDVFDHDARELMHMSGDELVRRWGAGEFRECFDQPDHGDLTSIAMMMSLVWPNA